VAEKDNKFSYVVDGKKELALDVPGRLIFSADGTSAAYAAVIEGKWHVVKDGIKGPAFKEIEAFTYSSATSDILYAVNNEEGNKSIVLNDVPGKFYAAIGSPLFSPNGKHYAYPASQGGKEMFMVIDGQEQPGRYPIIGIPAEEKPGKFSFAAQQPFFSSKGSRVAFPVYDPDSKTAFMVVDGKPQPSFEAVMQPIFSDDEKHVAYMAKKGGRWRMVVNGQMGANSCDGMIRGASIAFDTIERCFFILVASQKETGLSFSRLEFKVTDPT
jgi:Tol biopolymer transport system component